MTGFSLVAHAASMAEHGVFVFPVSGKVPMTANGLLDAVGTSSQARALFSQHPRATGIGANCGRSGLLVVDLDGPAGHDTWTRLLVKHGIVETVESLTGRTDGGRHLWFRTQDPRSRNTAKRLGVGIDTRGGNGYVVAPPSLHPSGTRYRWLGRREIAAAPEWLLEMLVPAPTPPIGDRRTLGPGERLTGYGRVALEGIADEMLAAGEGSRNDTLLAVARRAGRLAAAGELDGHLAQDVIITAALQTGLALDEAEKTFFNGFQFGQQYPTARAER